MSRKSIWRVHIVGLAPRTGTTLMQELMVHCFEFDGPSDHEVSIFKLPDDGVSVICTKSPRELAQVLDIGPIPGLWCICMVRDPRDVVVSRHERLPDRYYVNFQIFKDNFLALGRKGENYPNLVMVRYEDLVADPDGVQAELKRRIPILKETAKFSEFHKIAKPSEMAETALGGVRRISGSSIGKWRDHLPRIKAQIELFGPMSQMLREFGYEKDDSWLELLDQVRADNGQQERRPHSFYVRIREKLRNKLRVIAARRAYARMAGAKQN